MASRDLVGKRVLITGASSGIGWHLALELVRCGCVVLATARRSERLEQLAELTEKLTTESAGSFHWLAGDITEPSFRAQLLDEAGQEMEGVDLLINNAGVGAIGSFEEATPERLRKVMEVDFFSPVELTRSALPLLREGNKPAIVLIGSVLSHRGVPGKSEYCAAKFALRGWSEAIRCELAAEAIDVIMISPSTTKSEFWDSLVDTAEGTKSKSLGAMTPQRVAQIARRAIEKGTREVILSLGGKGLVWTGRLLPKTLDRILKRFS